MAHAAFEHQIAYITAKIDIELPNSSRTIGTGFFYSASLNTDTDRHLILLISNKHVFGNPEEGRLIVSLNRVKQDNAPDLGNIRKFDQIGFKDAYYPHPNPEVDLACLNVSAISRVDVSYMYLNDALLRPIDYDKVALGSDVIFVGYPENCYDIVNNLPLIRKGSIASMPNVDFNGKGQIVLMRKSFQDQAGVPFLLIGTESIRYLALYHRQ